MPLDLTRTFVKQWYLCLPVKRMYSELLPLLP